MKSDVYGNPTTDVVDQGKFCPLPFVNTKLARCRENGCAWWDQRDKQCCVLSLTEELRKTRMTRNMSRE